MKMYIRIEGDDDANGASYEICCDAIYLMNAVVNLFKTLLRFSHGNLDPALTALEQCTNEMEHAYRMKRGDKNV